MADVKKKWTNIKDSFVKDVKGKKPRKSKGPPEHRKKYYLFDHLQFLIPFIQESKSSVKTEGEPSRKKVRKNLGEGTSAQQESTKPETMTPPLPLDVQQHAETLNAFAGQSATDALCRLDGDLSFMVSLLPTVKSMSEKQKIEFKIGVLQLVARIKFNDALQETYPPAPFMPDLRCFSAVPYQPFPFINQTVSSTQHQRQQRPSTGGDGASTTMKNEACSTASSPSSYNDDSTEESDS